MYVCMCFYSNGTLDKKIQMVPNSLSTNENDKATKLETETVEEHYMTPNIGSNVGSNTNSKQCDVLDKSPSKVRLLYIDI